MIFENVLVLNIFLFLHLKFTLLMDHGLEYYSVKTVKIEMFGTSGQCKGIFGNLGVFFGVSLN